MPDGFAPEDNFLEREKHWCLSLSYNMDAPTARRYATMLRVAEMAGLVRGVWGEAEAAAERRQRTVREARRQTEREHARAPADRQ